MAESKQEKTNLALTKASKVSVSVENKTVAKSRSATCIYMHQLFAACAQYFQARVAQHWQHVAHTPSYHKCQRAHTNVLFTLPRLRSRALSQFVCLSPSHTLCLAELVNMFVFTFAFVFAFLLDLHTQYITSARDTLTHTQTHRGNRRERERERERGEYACSGAALLENI